VERAVALAEDGDLEAAISLAWAHRGTVRPVERLPLAMALLPFSAMAAGDGSGAKLWCHGASLPQTGLAAVEGGIAPVELRG
jgi:hypothetical protein